MNKLIQALLILSLPLTSMGALTVNNGGGATNITSTSAWITASVVSTGAANPYLYSYWGTNGGGTNVASWGHTNSYGLSTQAAYSVQITGLSGSTIYYFRTHATNTYAATNSESAWASYTAQFITLTTPTSAPPSSVRAVTVDTNAVLKNPTNFFTVNTGLLFDAISGYSITNIPYGIVAASAYRGDWGNYVSNIAVYASNTVEPMITGKVDYVNATYTATVALAASAVQTESDPVATNLLYITSNAYVVADAALKADVTNRIEISSNHFELVKLNTNDSTYLAAITNTSLSGATSNAAWIIGRTAYFAINTNYGGGTITNMLSSDSSIVWGESGGPQPDGSVTAYVAGVVADYVKTNDAAITNFVDWKVESNIIARVTTNAGVVEVYHGAPAIAANYTDLTNRVALSSNRTEVVFTDLTNRNTIVSNMVAGLNTNTLRLTGGIMSGPMSNNVSIFGQYFAGDGGGLTNVPAGGLDHNSLGGLNDGEYQHLSVAEKSTATNAIRADGSVKPTGNQDWNGKAQTNIGALQVASLQVTDGATNGAMLISSNNLGQTKWSANISFYALMTNTFVYTNNVSRDITFSFEAEDYGNCWDGTYFVTPVHGKYLFSYTVYHQKVTGTELGGHRVELYDNDVIKVKNYSQGVGITDNSMANSISLTLTNGEIVYLKIIGASGHTNQLFGTTGIDLGYTLFQGTLTRELP